MAKELKELVSIHACERFATRIMNIELHENGLTFPQIEALTKKIYKIAIECHPTIFDMSSGHHKCAEYDCTLVVNDGVIVTVKKYEKDRCTDYKGGIHRSGSKFKKLKWERSGNKDDNLNPNITRKKIKNGNRYDKKSKRGSLKEF